MASNCVKCNISFCDCNLVNGECPSCRGSVAKSTASVEIDQSSEECDHTLSSQAAWLNILSRVLIRNQEAMMGVPREELSASINKLRMNLNGRNPCANDVSVVKRFALTALAKGL